MLEVEASDALAPAAPPLSSQQHAPPSHFELSSNAIDMNGLFAEIEVPQAKPAPKPKAHAEQESVEVDLSIELGGFGTQPGSSETNPATTDRGRSRWSRRLSIRFDQLARRIEALGGDGARST